MISIAMLQIFCLAALASLFPCAAQREEEASVNLTAGQIQVLREAHDEAVSSSRTAELELLSEFKSETFLARLASQGAGRGHRLSLFSPDELLSQVKQALLALEYSHNFGLDAESLKLHPGEDAMNLATIDAFNGRVPTMWDLRSAGSKLVENVSDEEWKILDASETGLYHLPDFANPDSPTAAEMAERPGYLAGNLRRIDISADRYGAIDVLVRGDVVMKRGVFVPSDTGGWETNCNKSLKPARNSSWITRMLEKVAAPCDPVRKASLGVLEHQLHTFLANSQTFGRVGGDLARSVYQLLEDEADVRPLEINMYTEVGLMGPLRVQDMKALVGSFPGLFGTKEGEQLRSFCLKHQIPLAWGLGGARTRVQEEARKIAWLPWEPVEFWPAGHARLLDPTAGWLATNASFKPDSSGQEAWQKVWEEVRAARGDGQKAPQKDEFQKWWDRLSLADMPVLPLKGSDCYSADLCFGTVAAKSSKARDCVCRLTPPEEAATSSQALFV